MADDTTDSDKRLMRQKREEEAMETRWYKCDGGKTRETKINIKANDTN